MKLNLTLMAIFASSLATVTVNAEYVVYKTKNQVQAYNKIATDFLKGPKLNVETYTVFKVESAKITVNELPQRIVFFKPAKGEIATNAEGKKLTKLLMDPRTPEEYENSIASKYAPYSGNWNVSVINSNTDKNYMFIYSYVVETEGSPIDRYGEEYSGLVKTFAAGNTNLKAAQSLKGSLTYVSGTLPLIPSQVGEDQGKGTVKYDKGATVPASAQATMAEAVGKVVEYLEGKGYNATWFE